MDKQVKPKKALRDPQGTRTKLLNAARREFAANGLNGARVDAIAARSGVNKQLLYYYFGNKENLFIAVLEAEYVKLRKKESQLQLEQLEPWQAIERLVGFTFDYIANNHQFVDLLNDENIHRARHVKQSKIIKDLHPKLQVLLSKILKRGEKEGLFRENVDPVEFYVSLSALCYFHISNGHTLSLIFDRNFIGRDACKQRRVHVLEFIKAYLKK